MNTSVWTPQHPEQTRMWQFMKFVTEKHHIQLPHYHDLHQWSIQAPADFWQDLCEFFKITFDTPAQQVLHETSHMIEAQWFQGAQFNIAEHLLSRRDDHVALISINEREERQSYTYAQLYTAVAQCAAGLRKAGVTQGDRVAAIMPNTAHTIIAMLATTSLGALWSSCSPDFGAQAILDRFGQIEPSILFITDGHQYQGKQFASSEKITLLSQSIKSLKQIIICPTLGLTLDKEIIPHVCYWEEFIQPATECQFVSLAFNHPVYIMFSSGTTGKPKCIIHGAGGTLLQHIKELALHTDMHSHDNMLFYTTCGWMMWNWMVSALALGSTLTLYEGSPTYPDPEHLFRIIAKEQVSVFGTGAKFLSMLEKEHVSLKDQHDLSSLRCILSTGSPLLPHQYDYVYQHIHPTVQLSSISGGTDIISCFALGNPLLPVYKGELQCIGLGMSVQVFDEQGKAITAQRGELVCTKPFPSMPIGFWNDTDQSAYRHAYFERFPGIWAHGDFAEMTTHHGLIIYGRSDAVLNPGGVRIGSAEIYRQLELIDDIIDSVVISQEWKEDVRIVLFVILQKGLTLTDALINTIKHTIRCNASPRHVPAKIIQVNDIPRTMNGKTAELTVKQIVHQQQITNLQALANPEALEQFKNRPELQC